MTTMIFKVKVRAYSSYTNEFNELQNGLRPDTILYTGTAAVDTVPFGASERKVNKAIKKRFGVINGPLPDHIHLLIWVQFDEKVFSTTHQPGREGEHTVFHEEPFKRSLSNFKESIIGTKVSDTKHSFEQVCRPVIKWLNDNQHPHVTVIITPTNAELTEGIQSTGRIMDYVKD